MSSFVSPSPQGGTCFSAAVLPACLLPVIRHAWWQGRRDGGWEQWEDDIIDVRSKWLRGFQDPALAQDTRAPWTREFYLELHVFCIAHAPLEPTLQVHKFEQLSFQPDGDLLNTQYWFSEEEPYRVKTYCLHQDIASC
ncbi:hypothetical protein RRG08_014970 [Elysia crispata]|uniref:Uncharacterized protein n=1 Tax=Elysia crispata TaxID=231223 RepID=A0AAE0ZVY3_9GAST|nr:hypothetical protein RRG08_014970 [Elysia crispata]